MRPLLPTLLFGLVLLTGCGGGGSGHGAPAHGHLSEKAALLALVRGNYLWPDTLPANVQPESYRTLPDLLDHLTETARGQGKDRGWSRLVEHGGLAGLQALDFKADTSLGLGMNILVRGTRLLVSEVLPGSGAGRASSEGSPPCDPGRRPGAVG